MADITPKFDPELQQTVESLVTARPDLMDPARLQLFENLLISHIETRKSGSVQSAEDARDRHAKQHERPESKFTAVAIYLCGAYTVTTLVALMLPAVPLYWLPAVALAGFFVTRYWVLHSDNPSTRKSG